MNECSRHVKPELSKHRHGNSRKTRLLQRKADLSILLYTMEHNRDLQPSEWQLLSLKRQLGEIEQQLKSIQGVKHHGSNDQ